MKDKVVALIICFFFGSLGIHQFYLGNTAKGICYLLFCWTGIPFILAIIDFISLLLISEHAFARKYNSQMYYTRF